MLQLKSVNKLHDIIIALSLFYLVLSEKVYSQVKQQVEAANSATYSTYKIVTFKEQVVEGKNFFVKVSLILDLPHFYPT